MASPRGDPLLGMTMSDAVSTIDKDNSLEDFQLQTSPLSNEYDNMLSSMLGNSCSDTILNSCNDNILATPRSKLMTMCDGGLGYMGVPGSLGMPLTGETKEVDKNKKEEPTVQTMEVGYLQVILDTYMKRLERTIVDTMALSEAKLQNSMRNVVRNEVRAVREEVEKEMTELKREMGKRQEASSRQVDEIAKLTQREIGKIREDTQKEICDLSKRISERPGPDGEQRIVIRNLQESPNEDIVEVVNDLLSQELQVNTRVQAAERKRTFNDKPGVVIADLRSKDDTIEILRNKRKLRDSENHSEVMIFKDKPLHVRQMEANFHTVINAVAKDQLVIQGGRVQNRQTRFSNQNHYRRRDDARQTTRDRSRSPLNREGNDGARTHDQNRPRTNVSRGNGGRGTSRGRGNNRPYNDRTDRH